MTFISWSSIIEKADLPEEIQRASQVMVLEGTDLSSLKERKIIPLKTAVAATERKSIERALQQNDHLGPAAQALSIDISTLLRKCKKLGITRIAALAKMQ